MKKMNKKGFTIVELVIVIAVIAILAAVLIPTFSGVVGKANESAAVQTARSTLTNALNMSSTAQLTGQTKDGGYQTMIVVDGYAFGYTGNELVAIDYPNSTNTLFLNNADNSARNQFNTIAISAENLAADANATKLTDATLPESVDKIYTIEGGKYVEVATANYEANKYYDGTEFVIKNVDKTIGAWNDNDNKLGCTELNGSGKVTLVDGHYYLGYTPAVTGTPGTPASWAAEILINSDFSNKVVVFTTFG